MAGIRERLLVGTFFNLVATVFNQGSTFLTNIIVARILTKDAFGEYAMVLSTLLTAATFSQVATGFAASKYVAEYRLKDPEKAGRILGVCGAVVLSLAGVASIILIFSSDWLAQRVLKAQQISGPLAIGTGFLFFSAVNGLQTGALSGFEAYRSLAKAGAASGLGVLVLVSVGAQLGGLTGAAIGLSAGALFRCAVHNWFLRAQWRSSDIQPRIRGSFRAESSFLYSFMLPSAAAQCYCPGMIWLANSILVRGSDGYSEMALYSVANNFRALVLFLPGVISSVGFSVLNHESAKGDVAQHQKVFRWNLACIALVCLSGAAALGLGGRQILRLFGDSYSNAYPMLLFLLAASVFEALTIGLYQYVLMKSKVWTQFLSIIVPREAFLVGLALFLTPRYGGLGLAIAYSSSVFLGMALHFVLVARLYRDESKDFALRSTGGDTHALAQ